MNCCIWTHEYYIRSTHHLLAETRVWSIFLQRQPISYFICHIPFWNEQITYVPYSQVLLLGTVCFVDCHFLSCYTACILYYTTKEIIVLERDYNIYKTFLIFNTQKQLFKLLKNFCIKNSQQFCYWFTRAVSNAVTYRHSITFSEEWRNEVILY